MEEIMKRRGAQFMVTVFAIVGSAIGFWACAVLIAGLHHSNWQISELLRQYMVATGMIKTFNTAVDFYSHIKGIEYLICVAFFVVFPLFYRYVNEDKKRVKTS
jgi:hypothetical protein